MMNAVGSDLVLRAAEQSTGASIEDGVGGGSGGARALLGDLVLQVLDEQHVAALVQHRKPVARYEHSRAAHIPLALLYVQHQAVQTRTCHRGLISARALWVTLQYWAYKTVSGQA